MSKIMIEHTTYPPGGLVESIELLCKRCDEPATHGYGDDFWLCDECHEAFRGWLDGGH